MTVAENHAFTLLMTTDAVGGVWTYALELCQALGAYGVKIHLVTMGPRPTARQKDEVEALPHVRLHVTEHALEWMQEPWQEVDAASVDLLELEQQISPDLIHLNGYCHAHLPWQAPVLMVAHSCVATWWQAVKGEAVPDQYGEYLRRVSAGLQAADMVVAPTGSFLQKMEETYGDFVLSRMIPNAREAAPFRPREKAPYICSMGRLWDEAKNLTLLDQVAAETGWPVKVAGKYDHPDQGQDASASHLELLGECSATEVCELLGSASIYAHPALYEPFGLSVLEAAHSGCALVLSDIPTLRENWQGAAVFADPHDSTAWKEAMNTLVTNPQLTQALGAVAQQRAGKFTPHLQAKSYWESYQQLTQAARHGKAAI